eukprot:2859181-Amphidinium_carterae.1
MHFTSLRLAFCLGVEKGIHFVLCVLELRKVSSGAVAGSPPELEAYLLFCCVLLCVDQHRLAHGPHVDVVMARVFAGVPLHSLVAFFLGFDSTSHLHTSGNSNSPEQAKCLAYS